MDLNNDEVAIVEQAIRRAMNQTSDYQEIYAYQGILEKLVGNDNAKSRLNRDGIRYDYDDSSDLV
jgi:hypothetical protein